MLITGARVDIAAGFDRGGWSCPQAIDSINRIEKKEEDEEGKRQEDSSIGNRADVARESRN